MKKMMMKRSAILFLSLLWLETISVADASSVVVLFGDSITVGQTNGSMIISGDGKAYFGDPSRKLTDILDDNLRPSVVLNWGEGGSPTGPTSLPGLVAYTNGLQRISSNLSQTRNTYPSSAYYVLILYGTNDFGWGIGSSTTGFNIQQMIQKARDQQFIPVVATLTPRNASVSSYNSQISAAAASKGAPLVDLFSIFNAAGGLSLLYDGLHPTNAGYQVIADAWFNQYLEAAIEPRSVVIAPIIYLLLD